MRRPFAILFLAAALSAAAGCGSRERLVVPRAPAPIPPTSPAPAAWLLFSSQGLGLETIRLDGTLFTGFLQSGRDPRWSPDGRRVVFRGVNYTDAMLYLGDLGSGATLRSWTLSRTMYGLTPDWSPRGDRILCRDAILDTAGGNLPVDMGTFQVVEGDTVYPRHLLQWAPREGQAYALAAAHRDAPDSNELYLAEVPSGRLLRRLTHDRIDETGCQVSPDGTRLAMAVASSAVIGGRPRDVSSIGVMTLADTALRMLGSGTNYDALPRWIAGGRGLVFLRRPYPTTTQLVFVDPDSAGSERMIISGVDPLSTPDAREFEVGQAVHPPRSEARSTRR